MKKEFICKQCEQIFYRTDNHNYRFCSIKCKQQGQIGIVRKPPKEFICQYCHTKFYRQVNSRSRNPTKLFCSPSCRNKARALKDIICPICENTFKPVKWNGANKPARKYCSKECADKGLIGKPSKRKQNDLIKIIAKLRRIYTSKEIGEKLRKSQSTITNLAGKYLKPLPENIAKKRQSDAAKYRMINDNPMKNPDIAQKVSSSLLYKFKNNKEFRENNLHAKALSNKRHGTKPELLCKQILETIGIQFEYQYVVKDKFIVDFKINNLIIQIDGEYWHGHPRFKPFSEKQISQQKRDKAQDKYLTKCGYTVIRIWENELSEITIRNILSMAT